MIWDYIIVGAGSAGCALAHRLVGSGKSVLLLEAGGADRSPFIKIPAGLVYTTTKYDWGYEVEPDPSRNGMREKLLRGKVLGGSSSINGTKYVRAAAADFNRWTTYCGNMGGWSADDVMPIFREIETSDQNSPERGRNGPLHVRTVKHPHAITRAFVESAQNGGHMFQADYNGLCQEGVAYTQFSQWRGFRRSAADAFIKPIRGRDNFRLCLNTFVQKIDIKDGRAVAVQFIEHGRVKVEAARDIILCAGALNSPKLLMLSGIGEERELKRHGIKTIIDLPAVGRHLKDQPLLRVSYRTRNPTYNLTEGIFQKLGIAAKFVLKGEGPISNLFEAVGFIRSAPSEPNPDIRLTFLAIGSSLEPDGSVKFAPYPSVAVSVIKSYPLGEGRVTLSSADPSALLKIDYPLLGDRTDVETMIRGIRAIRNIMGQSPIADMIVEETSPGASVRDDSGLEAFIRSRTGLSYHTIGTCRMGIGRDCVVDPYLRVRGLENLWIADASIMPDHISADTNATCMMIGAKLGQQLVEHNLAR